MKLTISIIFRCAMLTVVLFLAGILKSQDSGSSNRALTAGFGHFGAMIYWQGALPADGDLRIVRTDVARSIESRQWGLEVARSPEAFLQNTMHLTPPVFHGVFPFTEEAAHFFLGHANTAASVSEIPMHHTPNVLFALGLAVWDTTVVTGRTYRYQGFINDVAVDEGVVVETTLQTSVEWEPKYHSATDNELTIRCRWIIPEERKDEVYTFFGYRSPTFAPEFQLIPGERRFSTDSTGQILAIFTDTATMEKPGVYHYVIRTVDRFGHLGPLSEYAQGANFPPETDPLIVYLKGTGERERPVIHLKWRLRNPWRVRSLALYRSNNVNGPYDLIAHFSPQDSTYVDHVNEVMEPYFYYFELDDFARVEPQVSARFPGLTDYQWPAEIPKSVSVAVDGRHITVGWQRAGYQDRGFYVLRSRGFRDPDVTDVVSGFIRVVDGQDDYSWTDTSSVLSPEHHYTYAIISESIGYDKSPLSERVHARPQVPVFIAAPADLRMRHLSGREYLLSWQDQSGDESQHLFGYRVYQKDPKSQGGYRDITPGPGILLFENNYLVLTGITPRDTFAVRAINMFENESALSAPVALHDPFFYRFGPHYLMGKNEETGIRVRWNRPDSTEITGYKLYRIDASQKMEHIATPGMEHIDYLDTTARSGETYFYFITAEARDGTQSEASEMLVITRW